MSPSGQSVPWTTHNCPKYRCSAGQVGVGAEAIRPAPPESGPAGAVEASRTRRTGATRPKTGGSTVCGGIHVGVRGWKVLYGSLTEGCPASAGVSSRLRKNSGLPRAENCPTINAVLSRVLNELFELAYHMPNAAETLHTLRLGL